MEEKGYRIKGNHLTQQSAKKAGDGF